MPAQIRTQLAQQIVDTLKTICSHDINFIDVQGRICASTDPVRVGSYHVGGHEAAQIGQIVTIDRDDPLRDVRHGINMPIRFHGSTVAVIGITGAPEEVQKYADLAQRLTLLLLREHEIDARNYDTRTQTGYLVRALIDRENIAPAFASEVLARNGLSDDGGAWRTAVVQLRRDHEHPLSAVEAAVQDAVKGTGRCLVAYRFPNEYVLIFDDGEAPRWEGTLRRLAAAWAADIRVAVGSARRLSRQDLSFQAAKLALQSLEAGENFAAYESVRLEILLGSVPPNAADAYLAKCLDGLDAADKELLNLYFACEMSLKATAARCYLHINTVQYRLRRVKERCGLDPRRFREASELYTALRLEGLNRKEGPGPYSPTSTVYIPSPRTSRP